MSKESVMDGLSQLTISMYFQMKVQGFEKSTGIKIYSSHMYLYS